MRVKKRIHYEILKISLVVSLHIRSILKERFKKKKKKNNETKHKCKRVTGL